MNNAVDVAHLYKSYGAFTAVTDITFSVPSGTCASFLGPNGAGKTTCMKTLYGRADPDPHAETTMHVFGFDPRTQELDVKARTGVVPQDDNLDLDLNVEQNLMIYCAFYGLRRKYARRRIDELLEFMELGDRRRARVRELSGGMQRRLILARALLNEPRLLILDEPTTGLDPQVRHLIWDKLLDLKHQGITLLLTTHYMEEAFQLADNVLIMDKSRKVLEGHPRRILAENVESHVVELTNLTKLPAVEQTIDSRTIRREDSGSRVLLYSSDVSALKQVTGELDQWDYLYRETNLEDLFIKATGRRLNELQ